jgi:DNA-binding transcriptional regulator YhcF (GntR family)
MLKSYFARAGKRRCHGDKALEQLATDNTPIFQRIKDYLLAQIAAGQWKEGDVIPSEQALVKQFGVSRMTVNRAVRELTAEQVLTRRQGSGTFVAAQKYQAGNPQHCRRSARARPYPPQQPAIAGTNQGWRIAGQTV